jgi:hypothetical protein
LQHVVAASRRLYRIWRGQAVPGPIDHQVVAGTDPLRFGLRHLDDEGLAAVAEAAARRFGWRPVWRLADRPAWRDGRWLWRGAGLAVGLEKGGRVATCAEVLADGTGQARVTRIGTAY